MPNDKMLIDATHPEETRVVVLKNNRVDEFDYESAAKKLLRGNIYLAKVTRVEPSLQAAFIDYGGNRHGFLAFNEIHPDYYQIPVADRQALLEAEAEAAAQAEADADAAEEAARKRRAAKVPAAAAADSDDDDDEADSDADDIEEIGGVDETGGSAASWAEDVEESGAEGTALEQSAEHRFADIEPVADGDRFQPALPVSRYDDDAVVRSGGIEAAETNFLDGGENGLTHLEASNLDAADDTEEADTDGLHGGRLDPDSFDSESEQALGDSAENIESVGAEDAAEEVPVRRPRRLRSYKIQEVVRRRQIMLVQVVKEERGNKGAALTTYLSLAGRYTVLMPNTGRGGGISRKITNSADRKRLKEIAQELEIPDGMGLIVRTAGASRTKAEVKRDFEYLLRLWENVRDLTLQSTAPALVYEEGNLIKRSIRDLYSKEIDKVIVAGEGAYRDAKEFMRMIMPSHAQNVIPYQSPEPLFVHFQIERQLNAMYSPTVTLKSGGYIVLNQTEALVAIDVNSGRSTREHNIEDTALATNLEACDEVARQLRLRDLAGLIVIDFIDMEERRNNRNVERRLKDALKNDRARIQVGRISHFGLMEMSRQRLRTGIVEGSTSQCPHCSGTGVIRSVESVALAVLRSLEDTLAAGRRRNLAAVASVECALYLLNHKRDYIRDIEDRYGVKITVTADDTMHGATFRVDLGEERNDAKPVRSSQPIHAIAEAEIEHANLVDDSEFPIDVPNEIDEIEDVEDDEPSAREGARVGRNSSSRGDGGRREGGRREGGRSEGRRADSNRADTHKSDGKTDGARADGARSEQPRAEGETEGEARTGRRRRRRRGRGDRDEGVIGEPLNGDAGAMDLAAATAANGDSEADETTDTGDDVEGLIGAGGETGPNGERSESERSRRRRRGRRGGRRNRADGTGRETNGVEGALLDPIEGSDGTAKRDDEQLGQQPRDNYYGDQPAYARPAEPAVRTASTTANDDRGDQPGEVVPGSSLIRQWAAEATHDAAKLAASVANTVSSGLAEASRWNTPTNTSSAPHNDDLSPPVTPPVPEVPAGPPKKGWWQRQFSGD